MNLTSLKAIGTYFEQDSGAQVRHTLENIFQLDGQIGYQQFGLSEWNNAMRQIDLIVVDPQANSGQLQFDELRLELTKTICLHE